MVGGVAGDTVGVSSGGAVGSVTCDAEDSLTEGKVTDDVEWVITGGAVSGEIGAIVGGSSLKYNRRCQGCVRQTYRWRTRRGNRGDGDRRRLRVP